MDKTAPATNGLPASGDTYFAPAERAERRGLLQNIDFVSRNPLIDTLLSSAGGLLAVLNQQRQIVALNDTLLESLGVKDAADLFGLRLGEAIHCIHAHEMPGGCGTSKFCSTCGAAVAIVTSLSDNGPVERDCALTVEKKGRREDLFFRVRAHSVIIDGQRLLLLFLQDMTEHHRRAMLERVFLHDISNLVSGLVGNAELLNSTDEGNQSEEATELLQLSLRLAKEIQVQRAILATDPSAITLDPEKISAVDVGHELKQIFANHPAARGKQFCISPSRADRRFRTDPSLLIRVLANAVTNAFEATVEGDTVRLWHEDMDGGVTFCVWNREVIPEAVALRVFQRCFTTKQGAGRGIGTYVMRLLAEHYLRGKVDFTTSARDGTLFRVYVPDLSAKDDART